MVLGLRETQTLFDFVGMSGCVIRKRAAVPMFIPVGRSLVHKLDEHGLDSLIKAFVKAVGLQKRDMQCN